MKRSIVKFAVFGIGLLLLSFLASGGFADKVSPPRIYLTIPRGKTETAVLFLRGTTFNEEVSLYLTDIIVDRKGNFQFEKLEDWKFCARDWLKLYRVTKLEEKTPEGKVKTRIIAPLYKQKEVLALKTDRDTYIGIKVTVPFNIKPGQYYAGIMVEPAEFRTYRGVVEGKAVAVRKITRIAVPITITVPGRVSQLSGKAIFAGAEIKEDEIKILATFENTGNLIEFARGRAQIVNKADGKIYDDIVIKALNPIFPDGTGQIYPEMLRDFEGVVKRPLPVGDYEIRVAFDYGLKVRKARTRADFSVTQELAISLAELLTLATESELLEFELKPGGMVMKGLEITNLDFQPLRVAISIFPEKMPWLRITQTELNLRAGESKKIRFRIKIPRDEKAERSAKIVLTPERGKSITIDLIIKEVVNPKNQ